MSSYQSTIGLEIHVELKTLTKMFCDSPNDSNELKPNVNVCPICLGHPGTLPTINKVAVESVIRVGLALGGEINESTKFDRKNYFYPDLPKGYQISQYSQPLVVGGKLNDARIRRIHLEEDTGRLIHSQRDNFSLVDFNRAGVPLMELVTEPDIKSAEEAVRFAQELQLILRYLGVSGADMEKGQMRIEANVSVGRWSRGVWRTGSKVEVKNINSFRAVRDAIDFEVARQSKVMNSRKEVRHETRGWDESKKATVSQRAKEEAHDYRYFPEPDLPPIKISESFDLNNIKMSIPELPDKKRDRFKREFGLDSQKTEFLTSDVCLADYFEDAISELEAMDKTADPKVLVNYLISDLTGLLNESKTNFRDIKVSPERLAHLVVLISQGKIGSRQAKDILKKMFESGTDPETIINEEGLETVSDSNVILRVIKEIIKENKKAVDDYKKGKEASLKFLVGQAMSKLNGRADPNRLREIILENL